ncbi:hypothetical protein CERZMDRAFT_90924 [Cercospora zeae-maydis SCOH1-5]|uniref:Uncharacterized protein n=1 Tax=Cercospora zeae-maydis SCOH1-5 TaxID=717836 RepID=A0A6A6FDH1_9PEZI|nr:hypothetical protein CERZMDRAFT_90924 [Cercospora zeae-maydis SCOH1-5]
MYFSHVEPYVPFVWCAHIHFILDASCDVNAARPWRSHNGLARTAMGITRRTKISHVPALDTHRATLSQSAAVSCCKDTYTRLCWCGERSLLL